MVRKNPVDDDTEPQGVIQSILEQASPSAQMSRAQKAPASLLGKEGSAASPGAGAAGAQLKLSRAALHSQPGCLHQYHPSLPHTVSCMMISEHCIFISIFQPFDQLLARPVVSLSSFVVNKGRTIPAASAPWKNRGRTLDRSHQEVSPKGDGILKHAGTRAAAH